MKKTSVSSPDLDEFSLEENLGAPEMFAIRSETVPVKSRLNHSSLKNTKTFPFRKAGEPPQEDSASRSLSPPAGSNSEEVGVNHGIEGGPHLQAPHADNQSSLHLPIEEEDNPCLGEPEEDLLAFESWDSPPPLEDEDPENVAPVPRQNGESSVHVAPIFVQEEHPEQAAPSVAFRRRSLSSPGSPEKLPLFREKPPADPFPIAALGPFLASAAEAIQEAVQAPLDLCAQSILASLTLGVQGHADVDVLGRLSPISEFFLTIGESGERKSSIDQIALAPVRRIEAELFSEYCEQRTIYELEMEVFQREMKKIAKYEDPRERRQALSEIIAPDPPYFPVLTVDDPTSEGLGRFFKESRPSVGMFSSEGGSVIGGWAMLKENRLKTAANYSKLWDGGAIRSVRAKDGTVFIEGKRFTMHLMIQPEPAAVFLGDGTMENQGLFSRILIVNPESTIGERLIRPPSPEGARAIKAFQDQLYAILKVPLPVRESNCRHLTPRPLPLCSRAYREFTTFHDDVEAQLKAGGRLAGIRGFANKSPEHATRLAAILTLADNLEATEVPLEKMEAGAALARHYLGEALRQVSSAAAHPSLQLAQKVLEWIKVHSDQNHFSIVDLYQRGPMAIRNKAKAVEMVRILEDHNHVRKINGSLEVHGRKRQDVFRIL